MCINVPDPPEVGWQGNNCHLAVSIKPIDHEGSVTNTESLPRPTLDLLERGPSTTLASARVSGAGITSQHRNAVLARLQTVKDGGSHTQEHNLPDEFQEATGYVLPDLPECLQIPQPSDSLTPNAPRPIPSIICTYECNGSIIATYGKLHWERGFRLRLTCMTTFPTFRIAVLEKRTER